MGELRTADPVLLVVAAFSRHTPALTWARERLTELFGPVADTSPVFAFNQTAYYEAAMGSPLGKQFIVFQDLVEAAALARSKCLTNNLEKELARSGTYSVERPINLDPGVLSLGKFVLATTKDQAHRIYLGQGIFAEVTLRYQAGTFTPWPWTYADYRAPGVIAFLNAARQYYRDRLREGSVSQENCHGTT
jgi:hypothetical protein